MVTYQIISDSCCDFTAQQYQDNNVLCVPLSVFYQGKSHDNFSDPKSVKEFYDILRTGVTATTSAANPETWASVMEPVLASGKDVLVLAFTSALSATYQSAVIAADELSEKYPGRKTRVVDSRCAALAQGLLLWYACRKRDEGLSLEELTAWVEENKFHVCHWVTVDDLSHLKRGGRISGATALVGTMLNIKPVLHMDDNGKLVSMAKARGRKAAMQALVKKIGELGQGYDNDTIFICHGDCLEEANMLAGMVKEAYGTKEVFVGNLGTVIGSHAGPGTLSVFFMGSHR